MTLQLQTPEVAALYWAVFAPPLVDRIDGIAANLHLDLTPERHRWLLALDRRPLPLLDFLAQRCRSPRIGLVFESLWHFFLENDDATELLAHNLPIRNNERTLGELDIVYRCLRTGRIFHLELAVKFYLYRATPGDATIPASFWYGPELRDRFDLKLAHMRERQLTIAQEPAAEPVIATTTEEHGIDGVQFRFQGVLFSPPSLTIVPTAAGLNPCYSHGTQLTATQFESLAPTLDSFGILPKPSWLTLFGPKPAPTVAETVLQRCTKQPQLLIAQRGTARELLMVTAENWGKGQTHVTDRSG